MARIRAYDLEGKAIGGVMLTWDDTGDKRDRMYINNFPVSKIYPQEDGWIVFDVTWTDRAGKPRMNLKVKSHEYRRVTGDD
ncbi:MAG: hypothetical protein M3441_02670 [Chloroflexota bacterium]|nr:hypothetical protein [Chloroflexota bacterium]